MKACKIAAAKQARKELSTLYANMPEQGLPLNHPVAERIIRLKIVIMRCTSPV